MYNINQNVYESGFKIELISVIILHFIQSFYTYQVVTINESLY